MNAVFLCSDGPLAESLVGDWEHSGTPLGAVVVAVSRRRREASPPVDRMRPFAPLVIPVHYPVDWTDLAAQLGPVRSRLLVCYGFMRRIPDEFLRRFELGGLNFHPTLLPDYPGPHPTRCMVADRMQGVSGGMTLHRVSPQFDEGEVLAQSRFLAADYRSVEGYVQVASATMLAMLRDLLPRYSQAQLTTWPQPAHRPNWALYRPQCVLIGSGWTRDEVAAALDFLPRAKGLLLPGPPPAVERIVALDAVLGPPTGEPARCRRHCIEIDAADARLRLVRPGRAGRLFLVWSRNRGRWRRPAPPSPRVRPFGPPAWAKD